MSQHDFDITSSDANTGLGMRAAINAALEALATLSSDASAPSFTYPYMLWADTASDLLKVRNGGNTEWISLMELGTGKPMFIPDAVSATEIGYLDGVTSAIQTQINNVTSTVQTQLATLIPSGTKMLFVQTSAPTGWTKVTDHNDKALRVVSGTAGTGDGLDFTQAFASRTPTGWIDYHTLTINEIPSHNHGVNDPGHAHYVDNTVPYSNYSAGDNVNINIGTPVGRWSHTNTTNISIQNNGGNWGHNHGLGMNAMNFSVKYVDVIICTKN